MNEIKKERRPIAIDMVNLASAVAATMEELETYTIERLRPLSLPDNNSVRKEEAVMAGQEWPDIFDAVRSCLWRINKSAVGIRLRLEAVEV